MALGFWGESCKIESPLNFQRLLDQLYTPNWVVYAKRPFAGPEQVIEYLGRYSHKVAISNHRLLKVEQGKVTFSYKDYRQSGKKKCMTLDAVEFIRRFCLHILPSGFCKIRHYGILSSRCKTNALDACRKSLGVQPPDVIRDPNWKEVLAIGLGIDIEKCPKCEKGRMCPTTCLPGKRAPPTAVPPSIQLALPLNPIAIGSN